MGTGDGKTCERQPGSDEDRNNVGVCHEGAVHDVHGSGT